VKIGKKLKRLRLENGLTQEELADRCEVTRDTSLSWRGI
jgi:transcriptional regulator with XRE-family HTH domain